MVSRRLVALIAAPLLAIGCHDNPVNPEEGEPPFMGGNPTFTTIPEGPYRLNHYGSFAVFAARIAGLDAVLTRATVDEVRADANRDARTSGCPSAAGVHSTAFCWNTGDGADKDWYPQGITASWDATADGLYGGHLTILASWYDHRDVSASQNKGVRISFVNYDDPSDITYRHVLLVEPISTSDFRAVRMHAGGIAWYGDYLYVMDTGRGIRVFDLRHIWRAEAEGTMSHIGYYSGQYVAFNYRYVMPQVGEYIQVSTGSCPPGSADEPLCFSFSGLDRSTDPPSILVGEYYNKQTGARLVRYPLDPVTSLLATDASGTVAAVQAYSSPNHNLQGAVSYDGVYFMSRSYGDASGFFYRTELGGVPVSSRVVKYPEDLSYQPQTGRVWSLSENPGTRLVFTVTP